MRITLGKFIDAMELNGYNQAFGITIEEVDSVINAACALGQGFLNLNMRIYSGQFEIIMDDKGEETFFGFVVDANDVKRWPIQAITRQARFRFSESLNHPLYFDEADYKTRFQNYQGVRK